MGPRILSSSEGEACQGQSESYTTSGSRTGGGRAPQRFDLCPANPARKTVKARFWPWLSGFSPSKAFLRYSRAEGRLEKPRAIGVLYGVRVPGPGLWLQGFGFKSSPEERAAHAGTRSPPPKNKHGGLLKMHLTLSQHDCELQSSDFKEREVGSSCTT